MLLNRYGESQLGRYRRFDSPILRQRKDEVAEIAIIRAAHLLVYIDELREIGVPVERALARSRLPPWALEDADAYVSYALCLEWLAGCSSDMELMEFGFRAARRGSLATLVQDHRLV